jgi:methyl-accepting chemotaxis protein
MQVYTRKNLFPERDLQLRFITRFVATVTIWGTATVLVFTCLVSKKLDTLRYSSHIDAKNVGELLLPTTIVVHGVSLLIFTAFLAYTIHMLWKTLSPPLHSIKKDIIRISCGDLTGEVSLSKYDEFQSLAKELDEMRLGLREKIVNLKEQQQSLRDRAAELDRSLQEGTDFSMESATALRSAVERMKEEVQKFRF